MIQKSIYIIGLIICCIACNSDSANDCFQTEGSIIETSFDVGEFTEIRIEGEVSLVVKQGEAHEVLVETGENLLNDVTVSVDGETLIIKDDNKCNLFRDYGITKAIVTAPNLTLIRNSSSYDVRSDGVLLYSDLSLVSNTSGGIENVRKGGDFYLEINCERLKISANGQSIFYISGRANSANISFTDENPRFEGENLEVDELKIFQVSANDMIVNPQQKISGIIRGTGDVISVNRPSVNEVQEFYTGRLIFQD
ncbi:head GIN domain-containing protein [Ulvibacter antarcticus]|nr:head GIN domain-containing protein [Ulvibacter antarcticus]